MTTQDIAQLELRVAALERQSGAAAATWSAHEGLEPIRSIDVSGGGLCISQTGSAVTIFDTSITPGLKYMPWFCSAIRNGAFRNILKIWAGGQPLIQVDNKEYGRTSIHTATWSGSQTVHAGDWPTATAVEDKFTLDCAVANEIWLAANFPNIRNQQAITTTNWYFRIFPRRPLQAGAGAVPTNTATIKYRRICLVNVSPGLITTIYQLCPLGIIQLWW